MDCNRSTGSLDSIISRTRLLTWYPAQIDEVWDPKIGNETYLDDFEFTGEITDRKWSPCFRGTEGYGDITKMNFDVSAVAAAPGRGPLVSLLTSGLHVRYGLVWEECYPDPNAKHAWGVSRIDDWETCTYREENNQTSRVIPRDVNLKNGFNVRAGHHKKGHS